MSDVAPDHSSPITIAAIGVVSAILGAFGGAVAAIYARGRTDGQRDEKIANFELRIAHIERRCADSDTRHANSEQSLAVMRERVEANIRVTSEVKDIVQRLERRST